MLDLATLPLLGAAPRAGTLALARHRIGYRIAGRGRELIALLNGSVFNYHQWSPLLLPLLLLLLRGRARLLQLDYPGFGRSPRGAAPVVGMRAAAALLAEALDALGVRRAHLLGISLGSALGQALAIEHPARVASLAGFGNPCLAEPALAARLTNFREHLEALERLRHLWGTVIDAASVGLLLREVYAPGIFDGKRHPELSALERARLALIARAVRPMLVGTPVRSMVELFASYLERGAEEQEFFRAGLPRIPPSLPLLFIAGGRDRITPPAMARALGRALPWARLVELPRVSHMGPMLIPREALAVATTYARWWRAL